MSVIAKPLGGFLYTGPDLALASASWKSNVNTLFGFNAAGTAYTSFKPGSRFNSLTTLRQDGAYILDAATTGFELAGAVLTAGASSSGGSIEPLKLDSFSTFYSGGYCNVSLSISSPDATDTEFLLTFDSPGAFSYKLPLVDKVQVSVPNASAGQEMTLVAVASSGARLEHTFTVPA